MLTAADELLVHQIPETFASVFQADRSWTEKLWASVHANDGSLQISCGFGKYVNRNVIDGFGGVATSDTQWNVRASRELASDVNSIAVGPFRYEIVEPLKSVRLICEPNEYGVEYDVILTGSLPPFLEARWQRRHPFRVNQDILRYSQVGRARGWLKLDDRRVEIDPAAWWGQRDHSWGLRPGVGVPELGLQAPANLDRRLVTWCLMQFGGFEIFHSLENTGHDTNSYFSGALIRADAEVRIRDLDHELRFDDSSRKLLGGVLRFELESGDTMEVQVRPLGPGFRLGGGLYSGFRGGYHGMYRGPDHVEGERLNVGDLATIRELHQLRDTVCEFRSGDSLGYGVFLTNVTGAWPEYGLTEENSFL